jgi:hypothetical protein
MVRTVTMSDLRKNKPPPSPTDEHRANLSKGNYNRWDPLVDGGRRFSSAKRQLDDSPSAPTQVNKAARLDANKLFAEMQVHEEKLKTAKTALAEAQALGDEKDIFNAGPMGNVLGKMMTVITTLICHSEGLTSSFIDICKVSNQNEPTGKAPPPNSDKENAHGRPRSGTSTMNRKKTLSEEEILVRKIKQEIIKAEKSTILFDLDLGPVPIINKDTLSSKVTRAIHNSAAKGEEVSKGNFSANEAEEILDDLLTCANLEFLGNGSKKYFNSKKPSDDRNGKFCTVPAKLTFKTKDERIRAEQQIRKLCKVRCSIPYPRKLRDIVNNMIQDGRKASPGNFVRVKVDTENMKVTAAASIPQGNNKYKWEDLNISADIPLDVLDKTVQVTLDTEEAMDSQVS